MSEQTPKEQMSSFANAAGNVIGNAPRKPRLRLTTRGKFVAAGLAAGAVLSPVAADHLLPEQSLAVASAPVGPSGTDTAINEAITKLEQQGYAAAEERERDDVQTQAGNLINNGSNPNEVEVTVSKSAIFGNTNYHATDPDD